MAFGISENWIGKAERLDRCAYLIDLALGMSACIARIGNEISDWTVGHSQPRGRFQCSYLIMLKPRQKRTTGAGLRRSKIQSGQRRASAGRGERGSSRVRREARAGRDEFRSRLVPGEASAGRGEVRAKGVHGKGNK